MDGFAAAAALLPETVRAAAQEMTAGERMRCEELRLRRGYPPTALIGGRERELCCGPVTEDILRFVLERGTRSSLHTAEQSLSQGFVSAPGGVRIGVCGTAVTAGDRMTGLRSFSSLCLRLPRAVQGCADGIWDELTAGGFQSLLILSPPGGGKTTLLRELIRRLSESGLRVGAADERGELSGGEAGFSLGRHTDVLTGVPRARAVWMLVRTMGPQVIAMDEITEPSDAAALERAAGCGVSLIATVHGSGQEEAGRRPVLGRLMENGVFRRCVVISRAGGARRYQVRPLC